MLSRAGDRSYRKKRAMNGFSTTNSSWLRITVNPLVSFIINNIIRCGCKPHLPHRKKRRGWETSPTARGHLPREDRKLPNLKINLHLTAPTLGMGGHRLADQCHDNGILPVWIRDTPFNLLPDFDLSCTALVCLGCHASNRDMRTFRMHGRFRQNNL